MISHLNVICASRPATRKDQAERVARAWRLFRASNDGRMVPSRLAQAACYAPGHFHQIFAKLTGETTGAALRRRRLDAAAVRLAKTRASIIDIAFGAGFESHEGFTRAFRSRFNLSPSQFRQFFNLPGRSPRSVTLGFAFADFCEKTGH
ncbi:MAG: helix-turn-helix transcriptional regulator [Myxococcaceae bacterium]